MTVAVKMGKIKQKKTKLHSDSPLKSQTTNHDGKGIKKKFKSSVKQEAVEKVSTPSTNDGKKLKSSIKQEPVEGFSAPSNDIKNIQKKKKVKILDKAVVGNDKGVKRRNSDADNDNGEPIKKKKKPVSGNFSGNSKFQPKATKTEKTDWNKLKEEKKALKVKRKERKLEDIYQISIKAKSIYDVIRRKKCSPVEQKESLKTLHGLLRGKFVDCSFTHDMARVVELMIKLANIHKDFEVLNSVMDELIPSFTELASKKYAKHVVQVMINNATPELRKKMVEVLNGKVFRTLSRKLSRSAFEKLYLNIKPEDQAVLRRELYGPTHKLVSSSKITCLDDLIKEVPNMENSTLDNTKKVLTQLIEKNALTTRIVHATLLDYLSHRGTEDTFIDLVRPHILQLISSKEGVYIAMMCVWMSPAKGRKEIIKQLREAIIDLAAGEHTYMLLLAVFDSVDDTQLVYKVILHKLLSDDILSMAQNVHARKVLAYLCSWRDRLFFPTVLLSALQAGDSNPHSKKPKELRAKELQKLSSESLLKSVAERPKEWISNNKLVLLASLILKTGSGECLKAAQQAVAQYVVNPDSNSSKVDLSVADNAAVHVALKKVLQHDKERVTQNEDTFSAALVESLTDQHFPVWLKSNHCCFYLLTVLKNGPEDVVNKLREEIKKFRKGVWKNKDDIPVGGKAISELL